MVSALWHASADGNIQAVLDILKDAAPQDINISDHNGATPLIQAVKNAHLDVIKALLDKSLRFIFLSSHFLIFSFSDADVSFSPQQYTSDPIILDIIVSAHSENPHFAITPQDNNYPQDPNSDPAKRYYPVPPAPYPYYPGMPQPPPIPDGSIAYYPSLPLPDQSGPGNLPPPEIARFIPCRYFPACRYGSSCIFAHPQGPYYSGPMPPPPQYPPPYDHMAPHSYPPNYYGVPHPPPPVPSHINTPPSGPHNTPPNPPLIHARSGSDILSPVQGPFSPNQTPYGHMSPASSPYVHPGQAPIPLSIPALPPLHQPQSAHGPQSPQIMYHNVAHNGSASAPPFTVRSDPVALYPPQAVNIHSNFPDMNGGPKSPPMHASENGYGQVSNYRDSMGHHRRGSMRRGSLGGGRKPPCLFFPSGRCRNGDDCRFPHVLPDGPNVHHPSNFAGRGPRRGGAPNGFPPIEEKNSNTSAREVQETAHRQNGFEGSTRSQSTDAGSRSRYVQGLKSGHVPRVDKKTAQRQRVPNADDFPVLGGSTTPPSRGSASGGPLFNGLNGPTAAQILQAPPPLRKDNMKESVPSEQRPPRNVQDSKPVVEHNGVQTDVSHDNAITTKLPMSFAAITNGTPDVVKEVFVSA
ncbi:hypothetical protein SERLA73DRAFT_118646 [Serpula lacrymans var. lacrymans S7.3]|uniref:C3H1-type domain-containing protein n=1 Tax=Serpula lacrymans var. lacrymans (strain S7.3) TaxID=936435 RepID=F8PGD8_SERL3|nr:hypothetical protein SERLA73DRAFT_118646 [Serpula lacrymans var. lacrymans S7.3]